MRKLKAAERRYLYRLSIAVLPILTAYGYIAPDKASLWQALLAAALTAAPGALALRNITPDES